MLPARDYAPAPESSATVVAAYMAHLGVTGRGNASYERGARAFLLRWPDPQTWATLPLDQRLEARSQTKPFVTFLMVSRRLRPGYD